MPVPEGLALSGWSDGFAESFKGTFEWVIGAQLGKLGVRADQIHFIRANGLIHNGGSLHCGTNTLRSNARVCPPVGQRSVSQ